MQRLPSEAMFVMMIMKVAQEAQENGSEPAMSPAEDPLVKSSPQSGVLSRSAWISSYQSDHRESMSPHEMIGSPPRALPQTKKLLLTLLLTRAWVETAGIKPASEKRTTPGTNGKRHKTDPLSLHWAGLGVSRTSRFGSGLSAWLLGYVNRRSRRCTRRLLLPERNSDYLINTIFFESTKLPALI
jgi:hypothetical protein